VLNDFEAVGVGVTALGDDDVLKLHDVPAEDKVRTHCACMHPHMLVCAKSCTCIQAPASTRSRV
jgi:hypothetical protein